MRDDVDVDEGDAAAREKDAMTPVSPPTLLTRIVKVFTPYTEPRGAENDEGDENIVELGGMLLTRAPLR